VPYGKAIGNLPICMAKTQCSCLGSAVRSGWSAPRFALAERNNAAGFVRFSDEAIARCRHQLLQANEIQTVTLQPALICRELPQVLTEQVGGGQQRRDRLVRIAPSSLVCFIRSETVRSKKAG